MSDVVNPGAPAVVPTAPVNPAVNTASMSPVQREQVALDAIKNLRTRREASAVPAQSTSSEPASQAPTSQVTKEATPDVDAEVDDTESLTEDYLDELDTDDNVAGVQVKDDDVVFTLDDGTPVTAKEARERYVGSQEVAEATKELSDLRNLMTHRQSIVDQAANFYADRLPLLINRLQQTIPPEPPAEWRTTRTLEYWDATNARREAQEEIGRLQNEQRQLAEAHRQVDELRNNQRFHEETQELLKKLPKWRNPKIAAKERAAITKYGRQMGMTDAELSVVDHRFVLVLRDAVLGAKVRANNAANGKVTANRDPSVNTSRTAGINAQIPRTAATTSQTPPAVKVDPDASRPDRFKQGAALLARRRLAGAPPPSR